MHPERQGPRHQRHHAHVQALDVGFHGGPSVDHEEHIPVAVVEPPLGPSLPVGVHRVDAIRAEILLAIIHDALDLGHHPVDHVRAVTGRHTRYVGRALEGCEGATAQIQDVELHLFRGVHQAQRHHHRPQSGRLARQRPADHSEMAIGAGEVELQDVAALLQGKVHDPDRDAQRPAGPPRRRNQPQVRHHREVLHHRVHRVRDVQRRQPHLMGRHALALHPGDGYVHLGHVDPLFVAGFHNRTAGDGLLHGLLLLGDQLGREGQDLDRATASPFPSHGLRLPGGGWGGHVGGSETDHLVRARFQVPDAGVGR